MIVLVVDTLSEYSLSELSDTSATLDTCIERHSPDILLLCMERVIPGRNQALLSVFFSFQRLSPGVALYYVALTKDILKIWLCVALPIVSNRCHSSVNPEHH